MTIDEFMRKLVARAETIVFPKTPKTINSIPVFYFEAVLSALRGPQPDAETGLVRCGCGGKARIEESPFADDVDNIGLKIYTVGCTGCTIGFEGYFTSNEDAQEHWNTAMGWRAEE